MEFTSILLISIGLAMDAFAVSLTVGIKSNEALRRKIALKAGLFFGIFQGIMPFIGWALGISFTSYIEKIDHWIAFILLGFIGGKMVYESFKVEEESNIDYNSNKSFLLLAIATSIDALAAGVSFAFLKINIIFVIITIAITTFVLSVAGVYIGRKVGKVLKSKAELVGGILLILMGVKILLEHLGIFS